MKIDQNTVLCSYNEKLLIGKPIFDFLPNININSETDIKIIDGWIKSFRKRKISYIITKRNSQLTLWKEEIVPSSPRKAQKIYQLN